MTTDFAGDPAVNPALITTPSGGEDRTATSVQVPLEQLADRTAYLQRGAKFAAYNWIGSQRWDFDSGTTNAAFALAGNGIDRWVAVGNANGVETGVAHCVNAASEWEQTTSGVGNFNARAITWDSTNALFIFVGAGGNIRTASDGLAYTTRASGGATTLLAVHTNTAGVTVAAGEHDGSDMFAVRATNGTAYATPTTSPSGSAGDKINAIASNGAVFVACGQTSGAVPLIWLSTDSGDVWSVVTIPGSFTDAAVDITWDGTRFLILGDDSAMITSLTGATGTWGSALTGPAIGPGTLPVSLAADPSSGAIVAFGGSNDFEVSFDSAVTWAKVPHAAHADGANADYATIAFDGTAWAAVSFDASSTPDSIMGAQSLVVVP